MTPAAKQRLTDFLEGLFDLLQEPTGIEVVRETDREIELNLQGTAIFDGADEKTLRSLGYLAEIAVRRTTGEAVKVQLDANGYRRRRAEELTRLASEWADEVLSTGSALELEPMVPFERKLIHEALANVQGVRTFSKGRGPDRHVVIDVVEDADVSGRGSD